MAREVAARSADRPLPLQSSIPPGTMMNTVDDDRPRRGNRIADLDGCREQPHRVFQTTSAAVMYAQHGLPFADGRTDMGDDFDADAGIDNVVQRGASGAQGDSRLADLPGMQR